MFYDLCAHVFVPAHCDFFCCWQRNLVLCTLSSCFVNSSCAVVMLSVMVYNEGSCVVIWRNSYIVNNPGCGTYLHSYISKIRINKCKEVEDYSDSEQPIGLVTSTNRTLILVSFTVAKRFLSNFGQLVNKDRRLETERRWRGERNIKYTYNVTNYNWNHGILWV